MPEVNDVHRISELIPHYALVKVSERGDLSQLAELESELLKAFPSPECALDRWRCTPVSCGVCRVRGHR